MKKINVHGNNLLLKKQEVKQSGFINAGAANDNSALYDVVFAGPEAEYKVGQVVLLKPGSYDSITVENETYLYADDQQLIGDVK